MVKTQNKQKEVFNAALYLGDYARVRITISIRIS